MAQGSRGGFPTYWTTYGAGPRAGLLIHCSLADAGIWALMARDLAAESRLTAFDLPGHGQSGTWDDRGEMSAICAGIAADFAAEAAPVDVIGHSFGGVVALRLAVEHPELVRSLVLIEPVLFAAGLQRRPELCAEHLAQHRAFAAALKAGDLEAAARGFIGEWGGGRPWAGFSAAQQARMTEQIPLIAAADAALYRDIGGLLAPGVLERLDIPVLLLEGSLAPVIIPAITEALAARLPDVRSKVIEGAGHMLVATHPEQVSAEVLHLWRGL